jgi:transcriptional regulator with XRE-family HTH domain
MAKLGEVIRSAREARGWKQEKLAAEAELSDGWVGQAETNRIGRPAPDVLRRVSRALDISYATLALAAYEVDDDEAVDLKLLQIGGLASPQARREAFASLPQATQLPLLQLMRDLFVGAAQQLEATIERIDPNHQE